MAMMRSTIIKQAPASTGIPYSGKKKMLNDKNDRSDRQADVPVPKDSG